MSVSGRGVGECVGEGCRWVCGGQAVGECVGEGCKCFWGRGQVSV